MLGDILSGLGYALDTPGALTRGLLAGRPGERVSGEELFGLEDEPVLGFLANVVTDPLTYMGGFGAAKGASKLAKGRAPLIADDAASPLARMVEGPVPDIPVPAMEAAAAAAPVKLQEGPWYSRLEEAIRGGPESVKAESMLNILKKQGVSDDELQWTKMGALAGRGGRVSRDDMLQHFGENQVRVNEVLKGGEGNVPKWLDDPTTGEYFLEGTPFAVRQLPAVPPPKWNIVKEGHEFIARSPDGAAWGSGHTGQHAASEAQYMWSNTNQNGQWQIFDTVTGKPAESSGYTNVHHAHARAQELAGYTDADIPRWSDRVTPGGSNYKELLLTLPENKPYAAELEEHVAMHRRGQISAADLAEREADLRHRSVLRGDNFKSGHWDEPNILAHVRFNERVGPKGEKILHIEEIQSDWHQTAKKRGGYRPENKTTADLMAEQDQLQDQLDSLQERLQKSDPHLTTLGKEMIPEINELRGQIYAIQKQLDRPPPGPFSETWHELAMKRMLDWAAEHGFDKVTWNTGQAATEIVGGKLAGQKKFYDEVLPNFLKKYGKKFGTSVTEAANAYTPHEFPITDAMRKSILSRGQPLMSLAGLMGSGPLLAALMGQEEGING